MTYRLAGQTISAPDTGGHGLDMSNGQDWLVEDCLIDLSACPLGQLDEAVGVVWGSSTVFRRCVIRGAGKLVLCGSGDVEAVPKESGLLRPANWLPGVCRGLVATAGGQVRAENCHATRWWIRLEGHRGPHMSRSQAQALMARLENML